MNKFKPTIEQQRVLDYKGKNLIVSASAGSGKTSTLIELIASLIEKGCDVSRIMLLTFTKASAAEMKERLVSKLLSMTSSENAVEALDAITTADISTIHSFLEKTIKRNLNLLPIDEGFVILSEDEAKELKKQAFEKTEHSFKENNNQKYENLFLKFHNDRGALCELVESMNSFFASLPNTSIILEKHKTSQKEYYDDSIKFIVNKFSKEIAEINVNLFYLKDRFEDEKFITYIDDLLAYFDKDTTFDSLRKIAMAGFKANPTSKKCNQEDLSLLKETYQKAKELRENLIKISICNEKIYNRENYGQLEKDVYEFFETYVENLSTLKEENNSLDFNDLEKFAQMLLEKSDIKEELSSQYDYIFVDEYQDTNKVQESIIKNIALNAHFVAVGDPKQSIYGFRNATSEIIKNDIKTFSVEDNSSAEFLRLNFRSDPKILNFVNNVFEKVMTDESVGIDYKETSMLKAGKDDFNRSDLPSVRVDVFCPPKEEDEEKESKIYDIFEDRTFQVSTKSSQARLIALRINELLLKQIYDNKTESFRNITYNDVVILTRGRGEIVGDLVRELSACGIPVVSEVKANLKDNPEVMVLINLFKVLLDFQDDVSLLSVMASQIGGFSLEEMAELRLSSEDKEFYNIVRKSSEDKVVRFKEKIEKLKFIFDVKGAYQMLNSLLAETDYYLYLTSKDNPENEMFVIEKFLQIVKSMKNQFSLADIVEYFDQDNLEYQGGGNSGNAVTICTIHSSKGLEYPVVILADAGKSMMQPFKKRYILNEKYGLALDWFAREEDEILLTPTSYMLRALQNQKNFIDEIMLLYVAMTRAKNHLYIVGGMTEKAIKEICTDPLKAKSYLEMILSSYPILQKIEDNKKLLEEGMESNVVTEVADVFFEKKDQRVSESFDEEELKQYLNFEYPYQESVKTTYKNSVSALNKKEKEEKTDNPNSDFIEKGNAYHLALKEIEFEKILCLKDVEKEFENNEKLNKIKNLIDYQIIFNNIILLKDVLKNSKQVFKEKQFTSIVFLEEINGLKQEVMIQGIIDLFALGEENVLIDYKYTNNLSVDNLKKTYEKQIILYKKAIEKAYNIKINKLFLLSLKNNKLIKF